MEKKVVKIEKILVEMEKMKRMEKILVILEKIIVWILSLAKCVLETTQSRGVVSRRAHEGGIPGSVISV